MGEQWKAPNHSPQFHNRVTERCALFAFVLSCFALQCVCVWSYVLFGLERAQHLADVKAEFGGYILRHSVFWKNVIRNGNVDSHIVCGNNIAMNTIEYIVGVRRWSDRQHHAIPCNSFYFVVCSSSFLFIVHLMLLFKFVCCYNLGRFFLLLSLPLLLLPLLLLLLLLLLFCIAFWFGADSASELRGHDLASIENQPQNRNEW